METIRPVFNCLLHQVVSVIKQNQSQVPLDPLKKSVRKANTCSRQKARENVCKQVTIGFGFTSD